MNQPLLEIEDAWRLVLGAVETNETQTVEIAQAVGLTLAEPVVSDIDSPPFSKSMVDGFAIAHWEAPGKIYRVIDTVTAGNLPQSTIQDFQVTRIMTGCPLPQGTRGVVMVEETKELENGQVMVTSEKFREGQNIIPKGSVIRQGQTLMNRFQPIRSHDVGALAEFGHARPLVIRPSRVSILTTGDELVTPEQNPGPGQIRNSNASMLFALAAETGAAVLDLGIGRDNIQSLYPKIKEGLEGDVLIIAGGVSAGMLDLIPQCLAEHQVQQIFHKINLKPGKPLWFGKAPNGCLVFGLPGNPVSSLVCFKLFAEPAIRKQFLPFLPNVSFQSGILAEACQTRVGRRTFWPVRIDIQQKNEVENFLSVTPLPWKGSSDQVTFLHADGLVDLGSEAGELRAGTTVPVFLFR